MKKAEIAARDIHVSLWTVKRWSERPDWQAQAGVRNERLAMGETPSKASSPRGG